MSWELQKQQSNVGRLACCIYLTHRMKPSFHASCSMLLFCRGVLKLIVMVVGLQRIPSSVHLCLIYKLVAITTQSIGKANWLPVVSRSELLDSLLCLFFYNGTCGFTYCMLHGWKRPRKTCFLQERLPIPHDLSKHVNITGLGAGCGLIPDACRAIVADSACGSAPKSSYQQMNHSPSQNYVTAH